jgi:hypothetical protein
MAFTVLRCCRNSRRCWALNVTCTSYDLVASFPYPDGIAFTSALWKMFRDIRESWLVKVSMLHIITQCAAMFRRSVWYRVVLLQTFGKSRIFPSEITVDWLLFITAILRCIDTFRFFYIIILRRFLFWVLFFILAILISFKNTEVLLKTGHGHFIVNSFIEHNLLIYPYTFFYWLFICRFEPLYRAKLSSAVADFR